MYNKIFSSRARRCIYLIVLFIVVFSTAVFMIFVHRESLYGSISIPYLGKFLSYADIPIMLTAGLWGIVPAMVAFLLAFIDAAFYDINSAYTVSIHVIAMVGAYIMSNRKAYRHVWTTFLGGVILNAMLGGIWVIIGTIAEGEGLGGLDWNTILDNEIYVAGEVVIYCVSMYIFMHFAPARIKRAFPMGVDYIEGDELTGDIRDYRFIHNSRISRKLTWIVVAQALFLGVAAASFASLMMPAVADEVLSDTASDMQSFFERRKPPSESGGSAGDDTGSAGESASGDTNGGSVSGDISGPANGESSGNAPSGNMGQTNEKIAQERAQRAEKLVAQQRFVFNNAGAAFVMKLIIMILNVAIPLIVLETAAVQWLVARPVTALANSLNGFAGADRNEQEKKLKDLEVMRVNSKDEISDLYESISDMAHQINANVDQMLREEKLEEEVREAQRQSEFKSNFLNNVSHELRTPINAVLGLDEMIVRETNEENIREYAYDIASAGKSLLSLVNDILDSSKLEEGKMEILPVEYELGSTINDIINMISVKAADKGLKFDIDVDEHLPHILYGDEIRIKQVMVNILTNAVKYTEEGGFTFKLGFRKISDEDIMLTCAVTDTGIGIKEEDMKKLFSRFERIEESRNRTIEGTGLGMNIVKQLLGLMDSELKVESVYGQGSTFSFEVKQRVVSWEEMGDFMESYRRSLESAEKPKERFTAPCAEILVTDDTPMNLTVIRGLLKPTKILVDTAESGFETLDRICDKKYDVIFLDHRMPEMDGIETLQKMKELEGNLNADTPVISLTANAVSGARETYLNAGFVDYLSKPIDSAKLEKMLLHYLPEEKICMVENDDAGAEGVSAPVEGGTDGVTVAAYKTGTTAGVSDGFMSADGEAVGAPHNVRISDPALIEFSQIPGIEYGEAIKNCANEAVLYEAARDYCGDIIKKADMIEQYADAGDYENYTVLVHALKSSSRLIGAMSLSEEARRMEACGNKSKQGDVRAQREITKRTPLMVEIYRGYFGFMAPLFGMEEDDSDLAGAVEAAQDVRPEIPQEKLLEGLICLHDLTEAFDFDSMECVTGMMDEYRMPEDFAPRYKEIKEQIHNVDQGALLELLDECLLNVS